jgi:hypothetical protein
VLKFKKNKDQGLPFSLSGINLKKRRTMKTLMLILLISTSTICFGTNTRSIANQSPLQVETYHLNQEKTLKLNVNYAKSIILNKEQRKQLKGQAIYKVDLVYTRFKSDQRFNQQQLNEKRVNELKNAIPQLRNNANIKWTLIEQTGASDKLTAEKLFHGFVIHFGDGIDYKTLKNSYGSLQTPFTNYTIDVEKGGEIKHPSGTVVHIKPNSICYKDGSLVKGKVDIEYREFRDQADIAFSGIPMTFGEKGEDFNFSSVGMFELRGNQNGKELALSEPATVDFQATSGLPGVDFYQMDDNNGKWKRVKKINPKVGEPQLQGNTGNNIRANATVVGPVDVLAGRKVTVDWAPVKWTNGTDWVKLIYDNNTFHVTRSNKTEEWMDGRVKDVVKNNAKKVWGNIDFTQKDVDLLVDAIEKRSDQIDVWRANIVATALPTGIDPGHTYPSLVVGLQTAGFGVYNCDQIYRIPDKIQVLADYRDEETGELIENKHVLCLIDMQINGSFSFSPNSFTCSSSSQNALALFTSDKKVYLLNPEDYRNQNVNESGSYTFAMKDMTGKIKSTSDLRDWLGM